MKKCLKCGKTPEKEGSYCPECGAIVSGAKAKQGATETSVAIERPLVEEGKVLEEISEILNQEPKGETVPERQQEEREATLELALPDATQSAKESTESLTNVENSHKTTNPAELPLVAKQPKGKLMLVIGLIIVVIIGVAGVVGYQMISRQPIEILEKATLTFKGYDTVGTASYNETKLAALIKGKAMKKVGIPSNDIAGLISGDKQLSKKYQSNKALREKVAKADGMSAKVELTLSKSENLANGSQVTITAKDKNSEDNRLINSGSKKTEVTGLKAIQEVTLEEVLKEVTYSFTGFDGFGNLLVESHPYKAISAELFDNIRDDGKLSNEDRLKLKVTSEITKELLKKGKKLKRASSLEVKVSGLKSPLEVGNLTDCLVKIDELTKTYYDQVTLADLELEIDEAELKKAGAAISFKTSRQVSYLRIYEDGLTNKPAFEIQSIYQVDATMTAQGFSETDSFYESHGFLYVPLSQGKLNSDDAIDLPLVFEETLEEAVKELTESDKGYLKIDMTLEAGQGEKI